MQTNQPNRAKRFRIIVFATIIAFIVVIFGAWIITSAIKSAEKSRQQEITATEESKEEKTNKTETKAENKTEAKTEAKSSEKTNNQGQNNKISTASPADQYQNNKTTTTSNTTNGATKAASDLPSTGPEDLVFTAILAGVAVYLVCLNLNHKKSVA
mgnify:CR=1 FL=1|jgi:hypothetical protein